VPSRLASHGIRRASRYDAAAAVGASCPGRAKAELPRPREGIRITRSGCVSSLYTAILAKYREQMPKYYYDPTKYAIYPDQLGIKYSTERTDAKRPQQQS
jgi:hypothetical protein